MKKTDQSTLFLVFVFVSAVFSLMALFWISSPKLSLFGRDPLIILAEQLRGQEATAADKERMIISYVDKTDLASQVSVKVSENPVNQLLEQLKSKEITLADKERLIQQRETEINRVAYGRNLTQIFLIVGVTLLFWLMAVNFYLDRRRGSRIIKNLTRGPNNWRI